MTIEEIRNCNELSVIQARRAAVGQEAQMEGADLDALEAEMDALVERTNTLTDAAERRNRIAAAVAGGAAGTVTRSFQGLAGNPNEGPTFTAASPEFTNAWLKNVAKDENGNLLLGQMSDTERRAFTFLTTTPPTWCPRTS